MHAATIIHVAVEFVHSLVNNCCKESVAHFGTFASVNKGRENVQFLALKGVRPGQAPFPETLPETMHQCLLSTLSRVARTILPATHLTSARGMTLKLLKTTSVEAKGSVMDEIT